MILTCPQCDTRFVVPDQAIPDEGRKVRCAQCKHVWVQNKTQTKEAKSTDVAGGNTMPLASARSVEDEGAESAERDSSRNKWYHAILRMRDETQTGRAAFLGGFFIVIFLYAMSQFMTSPLIVGQGLAFHDVMIDRDGNNIIINGEIVNAMYDDRGVPDITITTYYGDAMGDTVHIAPDRNILHTGEITTFTHVINDIAPDVTDIRVGFHGAKASDHLKDHGKGNEAMINGSDDVETHHHGAEG